MTAMLRDTCIQIAGVAENCDARRAIDDMLDDRSFNTFDNTTGLNVDFRSCAVVDACMWINVYIYKS